jgi:hypothetical protein
MWDNLDGVGGREGKPLQKKENEVWCMENDENGGGSYHGNGTDIP